MCYAAAMEDDKPLERIAVRELRNYASRVVRRARAGERLLITVDGVAAAEIGPVTQHPAQRTLEELTASGLLIPPRRRDRPSPAAPIPAPGRRSTLDILREQRDQR